MFRWRAAIVAALVGGVAGGTWAGPLPADTPGAQQEAKRLDQLPPVPPAQTHRIDESGRNEKGRASYYANSFRDRKMADGRPMDPNSNVAASKTLPLGSVAKVTNLDNGRTTTVRIEDRGPYVKGRVVDLSPKVGRELGLQKKGVVPVEVKPITIPHRDGTVVPGAGAADTDPQEVTKAVDVTKQLTGRAPAETAEK